MKRFIFASLASFISTSVLANAVVPEKFLGVWTPADKTCENKLSFEVKPTSVILHNGELKKELGDIDVCFSCEGGARYSGIVVWLMTDANATGNDESITAQFNAGEKEGVTVIQIESKELQKQFPLNEVKLRKCQ